MIYFLDTSKGAVTSMSKSLRHICAFHFFSRQKAWFSLSHDHMIFSIKSLVLLKCARKSCKVNMLLTEPLFIMSFLKKSVVDLGSAWGQKTLLLLFFAHTPFKAKCIGVLQTASSHHFSLRMTWSWVKELSSRLSTNSCSE